MLGWIFNILCALSVVFIYLGTDSLWLMGAGAFGLAAVYAGVADLGVDTARRIGDETTEDIQELRSDLQDAFKKLNANIEKSRKK